jgi:hypothetical protein
MDTDRSKRRTAASHVVAIPSQARESQGKSLVFSVQREKTGGCGLRHELDCLSIPVPVKKEKGNLPFRPKKGAQLALSSQK